MVREEENKHNKKKKRGGGGDREGVWEVAVTSRNCPKERLANYTLTEE